MAGIVGGGDIGNLGITSGYQQFDTVTMIITVVY
jgi:D-methionine transport system permease protein